MIISLNTPKESLSDIALLTRERRLAINLTQEQLADQANVSVAVLRKFERTGKVSLESFVKLAFVLGLNDKLIESLRVRPETTASLDDILNASLKPKRQRASSGRHSHG